MRHSREEITIQGPAIEQLHQKRGCIERTCLSSIGCLGVVFIIAMLVLGFITRDRNTPVEDIPKELYESIYIYDKDIDDIQLVKGTEQHPILNAMAYLPKIALYPVLHFTDKNPDTELGFWSGYSSFLGRPLIEEHDSYSLIWYTISAKPDFLFELHAHELEERGFSINTQSERFMRFSNKSLIGEMTLTGDTIPYILTITLSPLSQ
ncbi:MAG: hypothetical protein HOE53_03085 [Candidatus Magasanikbacteria bacterium]|jgi:hypothetical protein|nr:hypothetical protein [Candidatus Magasanikbacteria bacterium]